MQTTQQTGYKHSNYKSQNSKMKMAVTRAEIEAALKVWGSNLVSISKAFRSGADHKKLAAELIKNTYNYGNGQVLFKPTLASQNTFRTTFDGALSYFVGGDSRFEEDRGFALNPWESVEFEIAGVVLGKTHGIVMGNKHLKDTSGKLILANFTMGFVRDSSGGLKINLHHSSLPYISN